MKYVLNEGLGTREPGSSAKHGNHYEYTAKNDLWNRKRRVLLEFASCILLTRLYGLAKERNGRKVHKQKEQMWLFGPLYSLTSLWKSFLKIQGFSFVCGGGGSIWSSGSLGELKQIPVVVDSHLLRRNQSHYSPSVLIYFWTCQDLTTVQADSDSVYF